MKPRTTVTLTAEDSAALNDLALALGIGSPNRRGSGSPSGLMATLAQSYQAAPTATVAAIRQAQTAGQRAQTGPTDPYADPPPGPDAAPLPAAVIQAYGDWQSAVAASQELTRRYNAEIHEGASSPATAAAFDRCFRYEVAAWGQLWAAMQP